jgi:hypothetical protein
MTRYQPHPRIYPFENIELNWWNYFNIKGSGMPEYYAFIEVDKVHQPTISMKEINRASADAVSGNVLAVEFAGYTMNMSREELNQAVYIRGQSNG